jgi:hypothetical protein
MKISDFNENSFYLHEVRKSKFRVRYFLTQMFIEEQSFKHLIDNFYGYGSRVPKNFLMVQISKMIKATKRQIPQPCRI